MAATTNPVEEPGQLSAADTDLLAAAHGLSALRRGNSYNESGMFELWGSHSAILLTRLLLVPSSSLHTPSLSISSSSAPSIISEPSTSTTSNLQGEVFVMNDTLVSRVSSIPIVNSAIRAYEQSKANSPVVKAGYGAYLHLSFR